MEYHIGIEDVEPNNWVAFVFEWPGCCSRGRARQDALNGVTSAIEEMRSRLNDTMVDTSAHQSPYTIKIAEEYQSFKSSPDYIVNAFFESDKIPLAKSDLVYAETIFDLNRKDLLNVISNLSDEVLDRPIDGEVQGDIRHIVKHIGTAEWWYWDRLNLAFPREQRPDDDIFKLLDTIRNFTLENLPRIVGSDQQTCRSKEYWSPRKLLRRAVWHERVHTMQIKKYLGI